MTNAIIVAAFCGWAAFAAVEVARFAWGFAAGLLPGVAAGMREEIEAVVRARQVPAATNIVEFKRRKT